MEKPSLDRMIVEWRLHLSEGGWVPIGSHPRIEAFIQLFHNLARVGYDIKKEIEDDYSNRKKIIDASVYAHKDKYPGKKKVRWENFVKEDLQKAIVKYLPVGFEFLTPDQLKKFENAIIEPTKRQEAPVERQGLPFTPEMEAKLSVVEVEPDEDFIEEMGIVADPNE
jgi:hypothetical protein